MIATPTRRPTPRPTRPTRPARVARRPRPTRADWSIGEVSRPTLADRAIDLETRAARGLADLRALAGRKLADWSKLAGRVGRRLTRAARVGLRAALADLRASETWTPTLDH